MAKTKRDAVQMASLLLTFAGLMQGNLLASHAQSFSSDPRQTRSDSYFIQGAVKKPGVYRIESAPSMLKLLALAGGLADSHGAVAFIIRRLSAQAAGQDPALKIINVRIDELLKGNLEAAANLEPGDIVNIPQADVFFVAGEVKSAGSFPFKEGVTLLQAISRARGVTSGARPGKALILRQDPTTGKRQEINVDLDAVMSRKQKDIPVLPNDIIIVPNARAKSLRFLDAPPIRLFSPCRGSGPCVARLDLNLLEAGNERDWPGRSAGE